MMQEFIQEIEETARAVANTMHTALIGKILMFNASTCTATVKPYGKLIFDDVEMTYPILDDVPIVFPFSDNGKYGMALPVQQGDNCLIIVSETDIEEWRQDVENAEQMNLRYDLSSAIAIPGLLRKGNNLVKIANKKKAVVVGNENVNIAITDKNIVLNGDLIVKGNIFYEGNCKSIKQDN